MSSMHKIIPLTAIMLLMTACSASSQTALPTEQGINTPQILPTKEATASRLVTQAPTGLPSANPVLTPTSEPVRGNGIILFGSTREGAYTNLYLLNIANGEVVQLTNEEANIFPGPFSPDGQKMLFTGFGLTNSYIGVRNADGTHPVTLSQDLEVDEGFPAWSPDGKQVVYISRRDGNNEIYIMNADGTRSSRLTDNPADDFAPAWSPDGSQIAFVSDRDHSTGINNMYLMKADGSEVTRLTNGDEIDYGPAWSPDGKQIAFRADVDGNGDIYVINADGGERVNLTDNPANDWSPAWSPDGSMIAFQTDRDGNWEIYSLNLEGGELTNLTQNPADDQMPYWKPMLPSID